MTVLLDVVLFLYLHAARGHPQKNSFNGGNRLVDLVGKGFPFGVGINKCLFTERRNFLQSRNDLESLYYISCALMKMGEVYFLGIFGNIPTWPNSTLMCVYLFKSCYDGCCGTSTKKRNAYL